MNEPTDPKDKLIRALATLGAHRAELRAGRKQVVDHARAQLDSLPGARHVIEQHIRGDAAGGILGHRRKRTIDVEHARLSGVMAAEEARARGQGGDDG